MQTGQTNAVGRGKRETRVSSLGNGSAQTTTWSIAIDGKEGGREMLLPLRSASDSPSREIRGACFEEFVSDAKVPSRMKPARRPPSTHSREE